MSGTGEPFDGAPPRPSPPKRPRESIVIEGKATHPARPGRAASLADRARELPWTAGAIGGLLGALIALAGAWLVASGSDPLARRVEALEAVAKAADAAAQARVGALEASAKAASSERRALAERLAAIEATPPPVVPVAQWERRLTALEDAEAPAAAERKAAADESQALKAAVAALKTDLAASATAAAAERKSLADEVARLQSATPDAAFDKRIAAVEGAVAPVAAEARAARDAADRALAAVGAIHPDPRSERLADQQARLAETLAADEDELGALRGRFDKLEAALSAPKAENRVAPSPAADRADLRAAARAVASLTLWRRWRAGEPIADDLATLDRLGVDAAALAPLRPFAASGAPTGAALARAFRSLEPQILAALHPATPEGGAVGRLVGAVQGLVKVRKVGESYGAEADAVASRIEAALARDDLDDALAAVRDLPPAAKDAARSWTAAAEARRAADGAAEALMQRAVAQLSGAEK